MAYTLEDKPFDATRKQYVCQVMRVKELLDTKSCDLLDKWIANRDISANQIAIRLNSVIDEFVVKERTVRNHRNGVCPCGKT